MAVYDDAVAFCAPGREPGGARPPVREGIAELGYPGQPTHPICHGVGARAHEPPYAHQAGGGEVEAGMVLAIEPGCYWEGGGGLRVEDNFLITAAGTEKLSPFPDGIVAADDRPREGLDGRRQRGCLAPQPHVTVGLYDTTLRDGEQTVGVVLTPRTSSRSRAHSTPPGSTGSRPASARLRGRLRAVELVAAAGLRAEVWGFSRAVPADVEALVELGVGASVIESPISDGKLARSA